MIGAASIPAGNRLPGDFRRLRLADPIEIAVWYRF